jgi:hypothetical protein
MGFDLGKMLEANGAIAEFYDFNKAEFLALIGTALDEYASKNGLDTNDVWDELYETHKEVFAKIGEADYMAK